MLSTPIRREYRQKLLYEITKQNRQSLKGVIGDKDSRKTPEEIWPK